MNKFKLKQFYRKILFLPRVIKNYFLCLRYPFLKIETDVYPWVRGYYVTWLDEMPIGWRKRFGKEMCEDIAKYIKANNIKDYHIDQLKEKFNQLTIYDNQGIHFFKAVLQKYEKLSTNTCVYCGKPATWITCSGWITSMCDDCKESKLKEKPYMKFHSLTNV